MMAVSHIRRKYATGTRDKHINICIRRQDEMSNLDWEDLQRRFHDYFYTARRLGFYVPELQQQEKSLMECCPYPQRKDDVK